MAQLVTEKYEVLVPRSRWVEYEDGSGGRSVDLPPERVVVELTIDIEKLIRRLGRKAAGNKSGRCRYLGGLIQIKKVG